MAARFTRSGRRIAATAVLSLAIGGIMAMAQDGSTPPPPPQQDGQGPPPGGMHGRGGEERRLEMMTKRLNLTPDQVTQIKAIMDDGRTQGRAIHEDTTMSDTDKHAKMVALHEAAQTKVRAVLNDEQKTKFDAMEARHQDHMQHGDGQAPPPPPPA